MKSKPRPPIWPAWLIGVVGVILTILVLAWLGSTYDDHGKPYLDDTLARVIVAGIGGAATVGAIFAQRALTQLHPNHGSSVADQIARIEAAVARAQKTADHAVRAARKASDDAAQTREDVQQVRADLTGQASDLRGIRKDIGRLADAATKGSS